MNQRGAISILAAASVGLTVLLASTTMGVASLVLARSQAQLAADAAALAAAPVTFAPFGTERSPSEEAAFFADANGARLVECQCDPDPVWRSRTATVSVTVDVPWMPLPDVIATASAEFDPTVWFHSPGDEYHPRAASDTG